ncbi:FAD-binding oxidoreductase [Aureimonas leprariae]|uniref:FAD-binding oxidoreductase n=1 Tax=Plantimonas leprariae TaxID=2615207 RepID=UPI001FE6A48C|nr:FAD-binding oxidoreductase [Aureimonas leprariae]
MASPSIKTDLPDLLQRSNRFENGLLARGLGRSYGDSNLNADGAVLDCRALAGITAFDPETGLLTAEGGASLDAILAFAVPQGFFLPVTPGTCFATLAGAIANDVHGKNHHGAGTIGRWIERIRLLRTDGSEHRLPPAEVSGLFAATVGGLGLTGVITEATIRLRRIATSDMEAETVPFPDLDGFFALAEASAASHEYTVAWIDCLASGRSLGRGLFTRANHATEGPLAVPARRGPAVPMDAPSLFLNRWTIGAMNTAYYALGRRRAGARRVPYEPFFYPLDAIRDWNRLYGRRGMYQYQSVVPPRFAREATRAMLGEIAKAGQGSFLVVLKTFGVLASPGLLSFPAEGTTLALDFPNRGASTLQLLARLDAIVREAGGRLYPAKDGRLPRDLFEAGYPALERFRAHIDPGLSSSFWRRVGEDS